MESPKHLLEHDSVCSGRVPGRAGQELASLATDASLARTQRSLVMEVA